MAQNPYMQALQGLKTSTNRPRPGTALIDNQDMVGQPGLAPGSSNTPPDPSVSNLQYSNRFKDELEDRLFTEERLGGGSEADALKGLIGRTERDIQENPLTAQHNQVEEYMGKRRGAIEQGYGGGAQQGANYLDPVQAANLASREMETHKIEAPERAARIAGESDIERQRVAGQGALEVEKTKQAGMEGRYNELLAAMQGTGNVSRVNIPGVGGFSRAADKPVAPGLLTTLTNARNAYDVAKQHTWFGEPAEKGALDQAIANVFGNHPAGQDLKDLAADVLSDPELSNLSVDQVLQHPKIHEKYDVDPSPQDLQWLNELIATGRGRLGGQP